VAKDERTASQVLAKFIFDRDAPDIRPDNLAFFKIRYPAGYRIWLTECPAGYRIHKKLDILPVLDH
jgi:hypothetical protein